jgi:hypothetical protein
MDETMQELWRAPVRRRLVRLCAVISGDPVAGAASGGIAAEYVGTVTMLNVAAALVTVSGVVVLRTLGSSHERPASLEFSPDSAPDPAETVADRTIR